MPSQPIDLERHLDPDHLAALRQVPARDIDPTDVPGTVAAIRAAGAARAQAVQVTLPATVTIEDHQAPGPEREGEGAPEVTVRLYRPDAVTHPSPAFYWIHGGGMIAGNIDGSDAYCANIADKLGILVASVEYRLAPEHPYPAPLEDCYAGLRWLASNAEALGIDPDRIAIGGGSAGAGLAAGLALLARDRGGPGIVYQHLIYPMLDDSNTTRSSHAILDSRVWNRDANRVGWNAYLGGRAGAEGVEPYAAPARATELTGLPPAYIAVGTLDLFVDEDIAYAQALLVADVPTELHIYPGAYHGSVNTVPAAALSQRWRTEELESLRRHLIA